jgi:hypothetical protein
MYMPDLDELYFNAIYIKYTNIQGSHFCIIICWSKATVIQRNAGANTLLKFVTVLRELKRL